jgi:hypothetical protein
MIERLRMNNAEAIAIVSGIWEAKHKELEEVARMAVDARLARQGDLARAREEIAGRIEREVDALALALNALRRTGSEP